MSVVAWWIDILQSGWAGALLALWLAATLLPLFGLLALDMADLTRLALRRVPAVVLTQRRVPQGFDET